MLSTIWTTRVRYLCIFVGLAVALLKTRNLYNFYFSFVLYFSGFEGPCKAVTLLKNKTHAKKKKKNVAVPLYL